MTRTMPAHLPDPDYDPVFYDGVLAKRFFAWLIDVVITVAITVLLGFATLFLAFGIWPVAYLAVAFIYRSGTIASSSATLGMRLMNIELRGPTGQRLTGQEAMLHTGAHLVCFAIFLLQVISVALMLTGPRGQGLHDHLLGTAAINRPG